MAPTIDPTMGDGALRSLWDAGRDLTTTAATCNELQRSLEAAQAEYTAAATKRDELYEVLVRRRVGLLERRDRAVEQFARSHGVAQDLRGAIAQPDAGQAELGAGERGPADRLPGKRLGEHPVGDHPRVVCHRPRVGPAGRAVTA